MTTETDLINNITTEISDFIKNNVIDNLKIQHFNDASDFVIAMISNITRWSKLLSDKKITQDDYQWLLLANKDLAQLNAIKKAGVNKIKRDAFFNGIIDVIVSTTLKVLPL